MQLLSGLPHRQLDYLQYWFSLGLLYFFYLCPLTNAWKMLGNECELVSKATKRCLSNGNRTEGSPIRSVIIRVITKSEDRAAGVRFVYHEYDLSLQTELDNTKS